MKNIRVFLSENFQFLVVKYSIYLNRRVFVMFFRDLKLSYTFSAAYLKSSPASILHKSTSGRHRAVSYPDGPMTARYRFT